ncbi:MAG: MoxR family ATPase [Chloroflexi bacterium]|nr:MAG: MoxR family ATPase [Chloroflexota bacterium]TMD79472.1 MAG: MoxR family ATPase [Chloroflexota bacterium]TMF03088.1 MAG: MoxR family ATPase [Chloroflexota bacterium]TMG26668.1 MAG: MoxR family ATPase [Chloroflexota bacterium]
MASDVVTRVSDAVMSNVGRAIVNKEDEVRLCLVTLLCEGHLLIEDVPGVGKTMLAKSLARSLDCTFRRIQFTPDLLPSDVTGVRAFNQKVGEFEFRPGPVFAQILLADEINRASPKTQAALLEAMEEHQVTIDGDTHDLPKPFLVMATQNPVEYSGTFPLPEAQLDRFLMKVRLGYLSEKEEANLLGQHKVESPMLELQPVVSPNELKLAQSAVREVFVKPELREYISRLVGRTRTSPEVALGASTRGTLNLYHASQAYAALLGRTYVLPDDIKVLAEPVLAHRIILRPNAEMQGQSAGKLVAGLLEREHVPQMAYDG